ncbi:MAG: thioredoxin family protein [Chlamydiales bacterium]|nr:thioredoxin family protein [Chlamydiales bacterium]
MKKWICLLTLCGSLLYGQEASLFITEDYQKAERVARENGIPLAVVFTGSDWSTDSKAFLSEWLFHKDRGKTLRHDLVFAWVDFPELNTKDAHLVELDFRLKEQLHITCFPTIVLLDPSGEEITRLGYPTEEDFAVLVKERLFIYEHLTEKWAQAKETQSEQLITTCYNEAQTLGLAPLLEEIVAFASDKRVCPELLFKRYVTLVNEGNRNHPDAKQLRHYLLKSDPHNEKGIREKIALFDFQEQRNAFPLETVLKQFCSHESENFWRIHLVLSEHFFENGKSEEALEHAQESYRYAPPLGKEVVSHLIKRISMTSHGESP